MRQPKQNNSPEQQEKNNNRTKTGKNSRGTANKKLEGPNHPAE